MTSALATRGRELERGGIVIANETGTSLLFKEGLRENLNPAAFLSILAKARIQKLLNDNDKKGLPL